MLLSLTALISYAGAEIVIGDRIEGGQVVGVDSACQQDRIGVSGGLTVSPVGAELLASGVKPSGRGHDAGVSDIRLVRRELPGAVVRVCRGRGIRRHRVVVDDHWRCCRSSDRLCSGAGLRRRSDCCRRLWRTSLGMRICIRSAGQCHRCDSSNSTVQPVPIPLRRRPGRLRLIGRNLPSVLIRHLDHLRDDQPRYRPAISARLSSRPRTPSLQPALLRFRSCQLPVHDLVGHAVVRLGYAHGYPPYLLFSAWVSAAPHQGGTGPVLPGPSSRHLAYRAAERP